MPLSKPQCPTRRLTMIDHPSQLAAIQDASTENCHPEPNVQTMGPTTIRRNCGNDTEN